MPATPAFESLVTEYGERAYQFAYRLTNNIEEARELVQEAYCRALSRWGKYDTAMPLENWFFAILRNVFLDGLRKYEAEHVLSLNEADEDSQSDYAEILEDRSERLLEALEREESGKTVRSAMDRLSKEHRAVLSLADVEGLSYEEIGKVLGCPVGTVRSRVARARAALKRKLVWREVGIRD
ncbi:MAG: RNA polymerase sigma factor [Elusimicrobia bacterium]|nr:RNA polymerase sigma factor [Elusimicrobiota bacterium]